MKTCDKCGADLVPGTKSPWEADGEHVHTPERCRDRLAARLAEVELERDTWKGRWSAENIGYIEASDDWRDAERKLATAVEALDRIAATQEGGLAAIDMRRSIAREALAAISAAGGKETK